MCHGEMATDIRATNDGMGPEDATQTTDVDDDALDRRKRSRVHINLCNFIENSDRKKCLDSCSRTMSNLSTTTTATTTRHNLTSCICPGRGSYELISISWLLDAVSEHVLPTDLSRYTICIL